MPTIAKRLETLEAGRGAPRVVILRQDLDDATIYHGDGRAYTEAEAAAMAQDPALLVIRIEYVDSWPPAN